MKRILAILLVLTMLLSFASCGSETSDDKDTEKEKITETDKKDNNEENKEDEEKPDSGNENTNVKISRGKINGNVYKNTFLNLTFTKPSDWNYATDEEIAATMNIAVDFFKEEYAQGLEEALEKNGSVYDMLAKTPDGGSNVIISYENLSKVGYDEVTAMDYAEILELQLTNMTTYDIDLEEPYEKTFLGEKYVIIDSASTVYGVTVYQRYYVRKVDKYMAAIIITSQSEKGLDDVEKMFS